MVKNLPKYHKDHTKKPKTPKLIAFKTRRIEYMYQKPLIKLIQATQQEISDLNTADVRLLTR